MKSVNKSVLLASVIGAFVFSACEKGVEVPAAVAQDAGAAAPASAVPAEAAAPVAPAPVAPAAQAVPAPVAAPAAAPEAPAAPVPETAH